VGKKKLRLEKVSWGKTTNEKILQRESQKKKKKEKTTKKKISGIRVQMRRTRGSLKKIPFRPHRVKEKWVKKKTKERGRDMPSKGKNQNEGRFPGPEASGEVSGEENQSETKFERRNGERGKNRKKSRVEKEKRYIRKSKKNL